MYEFLYNNHFKYECFYVYNTNVVQFDNSRLKLLKKWICAIFNTSFEKIQKKYKTNGK